MKTGKKGLDLIKQCEGLELVAYKCSAGVPTIGYGHTKGVKIGDKCTVEQAEQYLISDLAMTESAVQGLGLTQNEFDAIASLVFNIGVSAFKASTIRKLIVAKASKKDIAAQFIRWNKVKGKEVDGLTSRRLKESALFLQTENK